MTQETAGLLNLNLEAFSDGQVRSKLWFCEFLEKLPIAKQPSRYIILGSWYGILALFLLVRNKMQIQEMILNDMDPEALVISRKIVEKWTFTPPYIQFNNQDANQLNQNLFQCPENVPLVVVNTAVEHFSSIDWLARLPSGSHVLLQSTNMPHVTHCNLSSTLSDFKRFIEPYVHVRESDKISFDYPDKKFDRFMIYGERK